MKEKIDMLKKKLAETERKVGSLEAAKKKKKEEELLQEAAPLGRPLKKLITTGRIELRDDHRRKILDRLRAVEGGSINRLLREQE